MPEASERPRDPILGPYLQALVAAQVPPGEILGQAEALGSDLPSLGRLARTLLPPLPAAADPELAAICLVLGSCRHWRPLRAQAYRCLPAFLAPLSQADFLRFEALLEALGGDRAEAFSRTVLARLGFRQPPAKGPVQAPGTGWREAGWGRVAEPLDTQEAALRGRPSIRILGDLRIRDCPELEELPAIAVTESLVFDGRCGLCRLAPGTVIGRHLDLRNCARLEDIPRGIRVGGWMHLPQHLLRSAPVMARLEDAPNPAGDRYPDLHALLRGYRFQGLCAPGERAAASAAASAALARLRDEVRRDPRTEVGLLMTATEVWRDLAEEDWRNRAPADQDWDPECEEPCLPWLRELLETA